MRERGLRGAGCSAGIGARVMRGIVALLTASVAITMLPTEPAIAIAAGLVAVVALASATTGRCPLTWALSRRSGAAEAVAVPQYPDARAVASIQLDRYQTDRRRR